MKVSELIKELQKIKREHGDLEVYGGDPDENAAYQVTSAQRLYSPFDGEWAQVFSRIGPFCRECHRGCD